MEGLDIQKEKQATQWVSGLLPQGMKDAISPRVAEFGYNYTAYYNHVVVSWLQKNGHPNAVKPRTKPFSSLGAKNYTSTRDDDRFVKFRMEANTKAMFQSVAEKECRSMVQMLNFLLIEDMEVHGIQWPPVSENGKTVTA